jgi:hypothetical protein
MLPPRTNLLSYISHHSSTPIPDSPPELIPDNLTNLPVATGYYLRLLKLLEDPEEVTILALSSITPLPVSIPCSLRFLTIHNIQTTLTIPAVPFLHTLAISHCPLLAQLPTSSAITSLSLTATPALSFKCLSQSIAQNFGITSMSLSFNSQLAPVDISPLKRLTHFSFVAETDTVPVAPLVRQLCENCEDIETIRLRGGPVDVGMLTQLLRMGKVSRVEVGGLEEALAEGKEFRTRWEQPVVLSVQQGVKDGLQDKLRKIGVVVEVRKVNVVEVQKLLGPAPRLEEKK